MTIWIGYVMVVALVLSVAALLAERAAHLRHRPTRWIWVLGISASLLLPTVVASVSIELPSLSSPALSQRMIVLREAATVRLPSELRGVLLVPDTGATGEVDAWLKMLWLATSAALLLALAINVVSVAHRKRLWATVNLGRTPVYVADDVGPAVVGLIRPRIVVPRWLMLAPRAQQELVMAHEQSHLDAHDPQVLSLALCLLVTMPWNLPLWWQFVRLRRAIEVDCDARVLRGGHKLTDYGEALLAVGQRQSGFVGVVAAMSESTSFLEQRINIMLSKPVKWARALAAALACLSLAMLALAAEVRPPNATDASANPAQAMTLNASQLARYEGYYQLSEQQVMRVSRDGQRLFIQVTGQPALEVFARSESEFFAKDIDAQGTMVRDGQGRASALVWHQNGTDTAMPRIEEAQAQQIIAAAQARLKSQAAAPGSEVALRRLVAQLRQSPPNLDGISPVLATAIKAQHAHMKPMFDQLGEVKAMEFVGVGSAGWDKYLVRYEHGSATWQIQLGSGGVIEGALVTP